jgi:hypothetical protein
MPLSNAKIIVSNLIFLFINILIAKTIKTKNKNKEIRKGGA